MADIDWLSTLPTEILVGGYRRSTKDLLLESPMEQGPPKVRRRMTNNIDPFPCSMLMTTAQLAIFKPFHEDTLLGGALRFNFLDPDDGTTAIEVRIPKAEWEPVAPGHWIVDMQMVIYP